MEVERGEVLLLFPDRDRYGGRDLRNGDRREFYDREDKNRYQDYELKHDRGKIHSRYCSSRTSDSLSVLKNGKVHRDGSSRSPDLLTRSRRSDKISNKHSNELLIESKASKVVTNWLWKSEEQKFRVSSPLPQGKRRKVSPIMRSSEDKLVEDSVATDLASFGATEEGLVMVHDLQRGSAGNELKDGDLNEECASTRALSASKWADESDFVDKEDLSTDRKRSCERIDNDFYSYSEVEEVLEERYQIQRSGSLAESENAHRTCSFEMTGSNGVHGMEVDVEGHAAVVPDRTPETDYLDSDEDDDISSGSIAGDHKVLRDVNMLQECRSADSFQMLNKINEGTYGIVYKAKDKKTGEVVALKKVKLEREKDGFPQWALREINILLSLHHPSIVGVKEVVVGGKLDSIFMVMEYVEQDLKGFLKANKEKLTLREIKHLMLQLIEGVKYLHDNWVLHRDLKPSNVLVNDQLEVKICDFGMARQYGSPLRPYTQLVVTLIYRAPELLLGEKLYSTAVDMWSLGCIMAELLAGEPLFPGESEIDQLGKIFKILGTPNDDTWPGFASLPGSECKFVEQPYNKLRQKFPKISGTFFSGKPALSDVGYDLLSKFLTYDPEKRITAEDALKHPWFNEFPLPKQSEFLQTSPLAWSR